MSISTGSDPPLTQPFLPSSTLEVQDQPLIDDLLYEENKKRLEIALEMREKGKGDRGMTVETTLDKFMDTTKMVLDGLGILAKVHPVLSVVIYAFQGIVKMDIARRNNDKKVIVVMLHMQNMLHAMFELRGLKGSHFQHEEHEDRLTWLKNLCESISKDIKTCGSDLEHYANLMFLSKMIKCKAYEEMLKKHIVIFSDRRSDLNIAISAYMAHGIESIASGIIAMKEKLNDLDAKSIADKVFDKLSTPREKAVLQFLEEKGGPSRCINDSEMLRELLTIAGETLSKVNSPDQDEFTKLQRKLNEELSSDLKKTLQDNHSHFERLLTVQNNNVIEQIKSGFGDFWTTFATVFVYEDGMLTQRAPKLKDEEVHVVWEAMSQGLNSDAIQAENFVLAFHDHVLSRSITSSGGEVPSNTLSVSSPGIYQVSASHNQNKVTQKKDWVFEYVNESNIQYIVEAIDDDASGVISVDEASKFSISRPKELPLLHWMAYWAAGWHLNIANYQWNIYSILLEMSNLRPSIHIANRKHVDHYLRHTQCFRRVEALLRSIKPLPEKAGWEPNLRKVSKDIADAEFKRLGANLKEMSFLPESTHDIVSIGGEGRLETWILPLLYLVLTQHLAIMKIGCRIVLHENEFWNHEYTLYFIFYVFDERRRDLEDKFRRAHKNVEEEFKSFAYGMFFTAFKGKELNAAEDTTLSHHERRAFFYTLTTPDLGSDKAALLSILAEPPIHPPRFGLEQHERDTIFSVPNHAVHCLDGSWTLFRTQGSNHLPPAPILLSINPFFLDNTVQGKGRNFCTNFEISATFTAQATKSTKTVEMEFKRSPYDTPSSDSDSDLQSFKIVGQFNLDRDIIEGKWYIFSSGSNGQLTMRRTPPDIMRFRPLLDSPCDVAESTSRRQWRFARAAVLERIRSRLGSFKILCERLAERRRWIGLSIRFELADLENNDYQTSFHPSFSTEAAKEYNDLKQSIHPDVGNIYQEIASYIQKCADFGDVYCDACNRNIFSDRFQCIVCVRDDMEHRLDFCIDCHNKSPNATFKRFMIDSGYDHKLSHSLIHTRRPIRSYERRQLTYNARNWSLKLKKMFQEIDVKNLHRDSLYQDLSNGELREAPVHEKYTPAKCECCMRPINLPCYACVECGSGYFLICLDCQRDHMPVKRGSHAFKTHTQFHPLLLINDTKEEMPVGSEYGRLERRIEDMEVRMNDKFANGLSKLEEKLEKHVLQGIEPKGVDAGTTSNAAQANLDNAQPTSTNVSDLDEVGSNSQSQHKFAHSEDTKDSSEELIVNTSVENSDVVTLPHTSTDDEIHSAMVASIARRTEDNTNAHRGIEPLQKPADPTASVDQPVIQQLLTTTSSQSDTETELDGDGGVLSHSTDDKHNDSPIHVDDHFPEHTEALELKVDENRNKLDDRITLLGSSVNARLNALESKMDSVLSLLQQLIPAAQR